MHSKPIINLFGAPSSGKSTIAAGIFYKLKTMHKKVELVSEYAKELVYDKRDRLLKEDQAYIFAKQHRKIYSVIKDVDMLVSDSPFLLTLIYFNKKENIYDYELFEQFVVNTFNKYNNINFFLEYDPEYHQEYGRVHSKKDSVEIQEIIMDFLTKHNVKYISIKSNEQTVDKILQSLNTTI